MRGAKAEVLPTGVTTQSAISQGCGSSLYQRRPRGGCLERKVNHA
jgi:hypothetical protein